MTSSPPTSSDDRAEPWPARGRPFVPAGFHPPAPPRTPQFVLEPLGPQHNLADYNAWNSSSAHISSTPGFENSRWPHPMSLQENLADLEQHAQHFEQRVGFTYTVLDRDGDVVGCVYIYPDDQDPAVDARVRSWVRADRADWDQPLAELVTGWLEGPEWPFAVIRYR